MLLDLPFFRSELTKIDNFVQDVPFGFLKKFILMIKNSRYLHVNSEPIKRNMIFNFCLLKRQGGVPNLSLNVEET